MREYETTIIVQPEISDEGSATILEKMDGVLASNGATRLMCSDLGKRKLAYEIKKFQKGHYYILSFLDEGQVVPSLERNLRLEESVLRFMTIQVDDAVSNIEARVEHSRELEDEQRKRAAEKAVREEEENVARAEADKVAAEEAKARSEAEAKAKAAAEADAKAAAEGEADAEVATEASSETSTSEGAGEADTTSGESGSDDAAPKATHNDKSGEAS